MPTLFISYKRGTSAVAPVMQRLREAKYRLWFDRDEIHLGDPDWQARIDQGLEQCDGVLLNLTPAACASEPVRYEVRKAQELKKPIFPIVLERIDNWGAALEQVGLSPNQHTEDFTDVTKWDEQVERLLTDLRVQGLRVTRHEERQRRDPDNPKYTLHQTYLKRLVERIGTLNLAQISPENKRGIYLEQVYIDSPTSLGINVEVQDWQIIRWGIADKSNRLWNRKLQEKLREVQDAEVEMQAEPWYQPQSLGFEEAPFEALIGQVDDEIMRFREMNPDAKPSEEYRWRNRWNNGTKENLLALHLNHLAAARDRLVILGAPGSGKSTFVKYLALCLAGSGIDGWTREASIASLENWPHGALTPIYVELRRFIASEHFPADIATPASADHLWAYIQHELLSEDLQNYTDDLRYDLEQGHALLILDGLDEVPYPEGKLKERQEQLITLAQSLNTRYANSRILVASRPYAYEGWTLPGFTAVTISEFEDEHRIGLAQRLYQTSGLDEKSAREKATALNAQLQQIDPELKDRPLFVTLMATIYLKGDREGLPTRRGALYRESILLLLDRWTTSKPGVSSLVELLGDHSLDDLYMRLAALAYDVHQSYGDQPGTPEIDVGLLFKHLMPLGFQIAGPIIPYLSENAGVLVSPGQDNEKDVFHFAHRTFQEYLAAVHLVKKCSEADRFDLVAEHITSKNQVWRIPCTLAGDVLADTERRGDLWDLVDDLLEDEVAENRSAADPRWWTVWLASVILQEQALLNTGKLRRSEQAVSDQLSDWLVALVETPQALSPVERADCGRALSILNDPRPGVGAKNGLPDIDWVTIPGEDEWTYQDGKGHGLPTFEIARHPITFAQFQTFLDDPDGFADERWWEGLADEEYRRSNQEAPGTQRFQYANHPRESVSWYDAMAFCRWWSWKLTNRVYTLDEIAQWPVRLPTEYEWEKAARGNTGWTYPYGDEFDATKGNTSETGIDLTSAVGIFPDGASPYGVLDMSGNVWEWCLTDYSNPAEHPEAEDLQTSARRVLRGGSWYDDANDARAVFRDDYDPFNRDVNNGFRVLRPPSRES